MPPRSARVRRTITASAAALVAGLVVAGPVHAQTAPTTVNTVVLRMTGQMTVKLDKTFLTTMKNSKAKVSVKAGAKYSSKKRLVTLPIDASTTITISPGTADIVTTGTLMFRRPDGRKIVVDDIALRLRPEGADLSGTVRGRPQRQFAALTISPTMNIQQSETGYDFVDLQMLVSEDMAAAAKKAKIRGVRAGALLGLMTAQVTADLPSFSLPGLGGLVPALPTP
ncbi:MAG: hypothetical protein JHD16_11085 [Solirubrobacteraceae bacterium]|nr:hypothetical protein [Solirubrobacteraceae bacterium]